MKKILLSVVCLVMVGMQSVNAQVAIAALHQAGKVTIFPAGALQSAIDASVAGDTIYLSEGIFGGFTVDKPIKIIGAGQTTRISSEIQLGIDNSPIEEGFLLNGLNCIQGITFHGNINGARISQCRIGGTCYFCYLNNDNFDNIEIFMSQMNDLMIEQTSVKGLVVMASKINSVYYGGIMGLHFRNIGRNLTDYLEQGKHDRQLDEQLQAACRGVGSVFLVDRFDLFILFL